ncbi:MAG: hypothetical protein IKD89_01895 [Clostridia bacterium]|nr:hypothetical protein [Clostridia bacterium]
MGSHEDKIELIRKYHNRIRTSCDFHIKGSIPSRIIDNAIIKFARGLDRTTVIGFYDTTLKHSGKNGYIFTDDRVYYLEMLDRPKKLHYDEIESIELYDEHKKDCDRGIRFYLYDGSTVEWTSCFLNKTPLYRFFDELLAMERASAEARKAEFETRRQKLIEAFGDTHTETVVSRYCKTGRECIAALFEEGGAARVEVPSDKYDEAVAAFEEKKKEGGEEAPKARDAVLCGCFTYEQAKNAALSGKIDTLEYDARSGAVTTDSPFGITSVITLALVLWHGADINKADGESRSDAAVARYGEALKGLSAETAAGGITGVSEELISALGISAAAEFIGALAGERSIYGAAAKSVSKLLKNDALGAALPVVLLSAVDAVNIFRGRISRKQFFKNLADNSAASAASVAGALGGAAIGTAVMPGAGTLIGGVIGSIAAGGAAGKVSGRITGALVESDAAEMLAIIESVFSQMAFEYLLGRKEAEKTADRLIERLNAGLLKDMYSEKNRRGFARALLLPIIEDEVSKREHVSIPANAG